MAMRDLESNLPRGADSKATEIAEAPVSPSLLGRLRLHTFQKVRRACSSCELQGAAPASPTSTVRSPCSNITASTGLSSFSLGTNTEYGDQPRRCAVWVGVAIVTLTFQWMPLSQTQSCEGDWVHNRTTVEVDVLQNLIDHPMYGIRHGVQHTVYMWTAVALLIVLVDHRGRYRSTCMVQRWTWRYACFMLSRALVYWSLSWVIAVCPHDALVVYKTVEKTSNLLHLVSYFIFYYLAILKLWVLEQCSAAKTCFAILCVGMALIIGMLGLQLLEYMAKRTLPHQDAIYTAFSAGCASLCAACNVLEVVAMLRAAKAAEAQARLDNLPESKRKPALEAASWIRKTAWATALAGVSSVLLGASHAYNSTLSWRVRHNWAAQAFNCSCIILDDVSNTMCTAFLSGLVGPCLPQDQEQSLAIVGAHVVGLAERKVKAKLQQACNKRGTAAAAIQSLVDGADANSIFQQAKKRFRRIQWTKLCRLKHLMRGGPLDGHTDNAELFECYNHSEPCCLSECDIFLSHSWHDDFELKWAALARCCEEFRQRTGRYPTLWIDKFCINQCHIADDLQCLPVFLAGCKSLLVMAGRTYTSRLWCIMELYVYMMMQSKSDEHGVAIQVVALGHNDQELQVVKDSLASDFAAENCSCFNPQDKENIMSVIDKSAGGVNAFNTKARLLARTVLTDQHASIGKQLSNERKKTWRRAQKSLERKSTWRRATTA